MIECVGGGPLDGDMTDLMDGFPGEDLYVPVSGRPSFVPATRPAPESKPPGWMHHYVLRRSLEGTVWDYAGLVWR